MDIHKRMEKLTDLLESIKREMPEHIVFHCSLYARDKTVEDKDIYWVSNINTDSTLDDIKNVCYEISKNMWNFQEQLDDKE